MALAYPEGECFFKRSALNSSNKNFYQADRADHFYGHFLLEFIWNVPSHTGDSARQRRSHPRSTYHLNDLSTWTPPPVMLKTNGPYIGNWSQLPFVYGSHYSKGKQRRMQHNLCTNAKRLQAQVKGDAMESWFMIMPMPKRQEGWVFIDRLTNIRAIYIPVAHQASEDHPELCTFLHVNFAAANAAVSMFHHTCENNKVKKYWKKVTLKKTVGLPDWGNLTVGININGLVNLLSLPRQLRAQNAFTSKNIIIVESSLVASPKLERSFDDGTDFDWAKVAGANFGLSIQWKPAPKKQDWLENFLKNSLTIAVGFIPGIGPIAAIAFPLIWTAIADPDSFVDTWRNLCPGVDLQLKLLEAIKDSAKETREYLPEGWEQTALGPKFLSGPHASGTRVAALVADPGSNPGDLDTEALIINELKALEGESVDGLTQALDPGRPEDEIVILEADKEAVGGGDVKEDDHRLEDQVDAEVVPDKVTLDEVGPDMSFRLAEQALKDTARSEDESEWQKLMDIAMETAKDIASKLPTIPGLGNKDESSSNDGQDDAAEDPTVSDGPVNDFNWMDDYFKALFSGSLPLEGQA
ncbi:hypothetical protein BDV27DRAFT_789 [Aspergillus caelatus]|uniref:Uncharacterized protein n=1 Tax=Aspergillus caelatus TaxID=61420 RepID=A0A5N7AM00_9EURO|nr:uncharacterized protein BDV27DRAFT_789 [Aspergillus caelatus]KAE8370897.1 hypothetical protein BDV27DRAFT_789 [Aspergillus caelatus]